MGLCCCPTGYAARTERVERFGNIVSSPDKERLTSLFRFINPEISDFTFSNLIMWQKRLNTHLVWVGGFACLFTMPPDFPPFAYVPAGDFNGDPKGFARAMEFIKDMFACNGWKLIFRGVPASMVSLLTSMFLSCRCEEDRDFFDYVYLASDLIELRGKKYDGKRNHINKFKRLYDDYEYERLSVAHVDDCIRIMYHRCAENGCGCLGGDEYACDRKPSEGLLARIGELDFIGAVIKVNGRVEAFTCGEALNKDTAVVYIEKANARIEGLYTYINQQFCEREWAGMTYINREEDEGVPGLRKAKLSYHPVKMIEKYTIVC
jgi:hypothetical protein